MQGKLSCFTVLALLCVASHVPTLVLATHDGHTHGDGDLEEDVVEDDVHDNSTELAAEVDAHDDWGLVIMASGITCLPAALGIGLIAPCLKMGGGQEMPGWVNAFSSGVIFAAAAFLLLPEALHLVSEDTTDEVDGTWQWGTSMLGGWFFGLLVHHGVQLLAMSMQPANTENEKSEGQAEEARLGRIDYAVAAPVLVGDLMHNLVDGMSIGIAASLCSKSFVWTLALTTIAHEAPQEVADFSIFISKAGMKWWEAVLANFSSSLSTVIGAMLTYDAEVTSKTQGVLLAFGAGVYIFVAVTELGHEVVHLPNNNKAVFESLSKLLAFAIGAIAIGLVLLDHEHCEGSSEDGHEGHDH